MVPLFWKTVWQFLKLLSTKKPYEPANPLLGIYPKNENTHQYENLYMYGHSRICLNSQKVKHKHLTTFGEWKQNVFYPYNGILFDNEKE